MSDAAAVPLIEARALTKVYTGAGAPLRALDGVDLRIDRGEFVALVGPSGCGKSTLLHLCGAMDTPTSGHLAFEGVPLESLPDAELTRLRRERIGFVFQLFNLLPTLTVRENVALPLVLAGSTPAAVAARVDTALDRVGLGARAGHYPQQLSGGEMQRCAIARAVVHQPALLIADEPTGSLDTANGHRVLGLLAELRSSLNLTVILATHAGDVARAANRTIAMRDGRLDVLTPRVDPDAAVASKQPA
ncbi:MAG: ABC transporter ATP-binding protein [Vicinamibacterales bacterium]